MGLIPETLARVSLTNQYPKLGGITMIQSQRSVLLALGFNQRSDLTFIRETESRIELFYLCGNDFLILNKIFNLVSRQSFGSYLNNVQS